MSEQIILKQLGYKIMGFEVTDSNNPISDLKSVASTSSIATTILDIENVQYGKTRYVLCNH